MKLYRIVSRMQAGETQVNTYGTKYDTAEFQQGVIDILKESPPVEGVEYLLWLEPQPEEQT